MEESILSLDQESGLSPNLVTIALTEMEDLLFGHLNPLSYSTLVHS